MKKLFVLFLAALLALGCCACARDDNGPYEPDSPAPANHKGEFVSEHGTMRFNGDGKTVTINFDKTLAELCGLPDGEQAAEYVFLSGDLPPHGSYPVRYDTAHELQLKVGDQTVVIRMALIAADGKTVTAGVDHVTPERIPMYFSDDDSKVNVIFEKKSGT